MKRIERHRAILGVDDKATLSDLKKVYRKIMMEWHPDKFQDSEESKKMAEEKSTKLIASYHFLVSVHVETHAASKTEYMATITEASIDDFEFKSEIQFSYNSSDNSKIGVSYNHISNASLGDKNPGANSYMFNFFKKF